MSEERLGKKDGPQENETAKVRLFLQHHLADVSAYFIVGLALGQFLELPIISSLLVLTMLNPAVEYVLQEGMAPWSAQKKSRDLLKSELSWFLSSFWPWVSSLLCFLRPPGHS